MQHKEITKFSVLFMMLFVLTGCVASYEDLVPNINEFGSWDGNYFYAENKRTKTTGEDTEVLVTEVEYEQTTYEISEIIQYRFLAETIYLIVDTNEKNNENNDTLYNLLLSYSPLTKEVEVFYFSDEQSTHLRSFFYMGTNYIIVTKQLNFTINLWRLDLVTKELTGILEANEYYPLEDYYLMDDYLVMKKNSEFQYTKLDQINFKTFMSADYTDYRFKLIEKDEQKFFRIATSNYIAPYINYMELSFFRIEDEVMQIVYPMSNQRGISFFGDDYFVISEAKTYDFSSSMMYLNNELYKINYEDFAFSCEKIYTFDPDKQYSNGYVNKDGNLVFNAHWIQKRFLFIPGGSRYETYFLDMQTMKLKKYTPSRSKVISSIEYSGVKYFIDFEYYGGLMAHHTAYYLYREDLSTHEVILMQFFAVDKGSIKGTRYSEGFWQVDFRFLSENYLILNY